MIMLFLFHAGYFPGAWPIIQFFFIISGYLISSILLEDKHSSFKDYMARYFWRRTLRIFPLYYFVVAIAIAVYAITGIPKSVGDEWPYFITYTMNFARLRDGDVGETFVHFWSLAVEEQFYLIWPLVIYFIPKPLFKKLVIGLVVLSPLLRYAVYAVLDGDKNPFLAGRMIYVFSFTQLDSFALGAAVAVFKLETMKNVTRWWMLLMGTYWGMGFVMTCIYHFYGGGAQFENFGYPMFLVRYHQYAWGYTLFNFMSMMTMIAMIQRLWFVRWIYEWGPFVWLGRMCYGLYIYHLPIMLLVRHGFESAGFPIKGLPMHLIFFTTFVSCTIFVAWLSFRYVEGPFLSLKTKFYHRGEKSEASVKEQRVAAA